MSIPDDSAGQLSQGAGLDRTGLDRRQGQSYGLNRAGSGEDQATRQLDQLAPG